MTKETELRGASRSERTNQRWGERALATAMYRAGEDAAPSRLYRPGENIRRARQSDQYGPPTEFHFNPAIDDLLATSFPGGDTTEHRALNAIGAATRGELRERADAVGRLQTDIDLWRRRFDEVADIAAEQERTLAHAHERIATLQRENAEQASELMLLRNPPDIQGEGEGLDPNTGRPPRDHGTAEQALEYAVERFSDDPGTFMSFLHHWNEGAAFEAFRPFYAWLKEREPTAPENEPA